MATPAPPCSSETENWLKKRGVSFAPCKKIPLSSINVKRSRDNQARPEPINQENLERIMLGLKEGDEAPAIVVYSPSAKPDGPFSIVDGNHRDEAYRKLGRTHIWAYVLDFRTTSEMIRALEVEANVAGTWVPDAAWRTEQAVDLVRTHGFTVDMAADFSRIKVATVRMHVALRQADERIARLGLTKIWKEVGNATTRHRLIGIRDDAVLGLLVRVAVETDMPQGDVTKAVTEVKRLGSEEERLGYVGKIADERRLERANRKALGKAARIPSPKNQLLSGLGMMNSIENLQTLIETQFRTTFELVELDKRKEKAVNQLAIIDETVTKLLKRNKGTGDDG